MRALGGYSEQVVIQIDRVVSMRGRLTLVAAHPRDSNSLSIVGHHSHRNWARNEGWGRGSTWNWNGIGDDVVPDRAREAFQRSRFPIITDEGQRVRRKGVLWGRIVARKGIDHHESKYVSEHEHIPFNR